MSERVAKEMAGTHPQGAIWANQFDNTANRDAHYLGTGPEIWEQTDGKVDAFTCSVGTGGSLAGIGMALKERNKDVKIVLCDPPGSALHNFYKHGELKAEGESITEGIGQGRVTKNLVGAPIDDSYFIPDDETLRIVFELLKFEGHCMGTSTGVNVAAAIRLAKEMGPGHVIVTILADYGTRYQSKLFNVEYLKSKGLPYPDWMS
jgi:cysteine synthase A